MKESIKKDGNDYTVYYRTQLYEYEKKASEEFIRLFDTRIQLPFSEELIQEVEAETGMILNPGQRKAFEMFHTTGPKLLMGDPGTGKTTTVNLILRYLEKIMIQNGKKPKIVLCAPAGRAAQRMKETTGRTAYTIHKLIEYKPCGKNVKCKDANDPIDADIIVVDETSMLGLDIFCRLLGAVKDGTLILFVGDTNQLQSVDPGCVLQDMIDTKMVEFVHLTEVMRQSGDSPININAKRIINGETELLQDDSFEIIQTRPEETEHVLKECVQNYLRRYAEKDVQVLSSVKKGTCGVDRGNNILQELFNHDRSGACVIYAGKKYYAGDRVIMLSNNYALNYYNGDIGYIQCVNNAQIDILIGDETLIHLPKEQFGDMTLAYNCTVHKSQGSEYPHVILVLQKEAESLLERNLFYTAVTRAKKSITVIYEDNELEKAILRQRNGNRNSLLSERILWEKENE